ncbi:glycosyltransferase family 2 protein [Paenibacillus mesotrionivorans]|uniref:Glycosyltransferase family 2 protein n=1 Tax=Paenibacillus mesotrionivorans TaxID=3160968 RepID=A0ACC7P2W7_9BACL
MRANIVYTCAYNAEKTIERTILSMLAQTEQNWIWYMLDNGSADTTGDIIRKYAAKDERIVLLVNSQNWVMAPGNGWWEIIHSYQDTDCLCFLDADDEYKPNFLEHMLNFMTEYQLDIAACGYDFISASTGHQYASRVPERNLILDTPEAYGLHFPDYHVFMRTMWGKLYRISVIRQIDNERTPSLHIYGGDTRGTAEYFRNAQRVGLLAESLHRYYVSTTSSSYQLDATRFICDHVLDNQMRTILVDKCGAVSRQNHVFLLAVYFDGINDTYNVLKHAPLPASEELAALHTLLTSDSMRRYIAWTGGYGEEETRFYEEIVRRLIEGQVCRTQKGSQPAAEIILVLYPHLSNIISQDGLRFLFQAIPDLIEPLTKRNYADVLDGLHHWFDCHGSDHSLLTEFQVNLYRLLGKPDEERFVLLIDIKQTRPRSAESLQVDVQIYELMGKSLLLQNVSAGLANKFSPVVRLILQEDFLGALDKYIAVSENLEIADEDVESYFLLGQNLSAAAESADLYIYFKKLWIAYLLDCSRYAEASRELAEWEQALPGDEELAVFRQQLSNCP